MNKVAIVTDTAVTIPKEFVQEYGIYIASVLGLDSYRE